MSTKWPQGCSGSVQALKKTQKPSEESAEPGSARVNKISNRPTSDTWDGNRTTVTVTLSDQLTNYNSTLPHSLVSISCTVTDVDRILFRACI